MRSNQKKGQMNVQRHCVFCIHNVMAIDYKNINGMKRFLSSYGKIVPRRRSGVCAKHQRMLAQAVKRARQMALIPFLVK